MYRRAVHDSSRMRAMLFSTGLLLLGMVAVSFFGGGTIAVYLLPEPFKAHAPRPVLNVLISVSDGNSIYTINGEPAYTFKDDTAFSPPKGDNDYMKSYPLEGSTLVSNAHIDGTFTHVINNIGLPLYTRLPEGQDNLAVFNALNEYYAPAFSTANIKDYSSRLPALGSSWIYQPFVNGTRPIDASADVAVYDVDLRDVSPQQISALKSAGSVVMCRIIAGAALEQSAGSDSVVLGDAVLPKSSTVGPVPGKSGEHFLNIGLPSVKEAVVVLIKRAASSGCDGVEYMRTQFTSYQFAAVAKPEELAYHQWLTQNAHSQNMFSVLRNEGSLTASYASAYDVLVQQNMFLVNSDELASVFSSQNKPVFNVEDVEKYGFGAIPECSGRISLLSKCVMSILSKVRALENSNRNICEKSRDMHTSTIFRDFSDNHSSEVMACSPALISSYASISNPVSPHAAATVKSLVPSKSTHDGMGGVEGSGWFSAASSFPLNGLLLLVIALLSLSCL